MRCLNIGAILLAARSLGAQPAGNIYSLEKEAALGRQLAQEAEKHTTAIHNTRIDDYLRRLGARIAAQIPDPRFSFTFHVIADDPCRPSHEPGSFPGGYVLVTLALFAEADDEAEFAGMLAHAMEHVALRHGTRIAGQGQIENRTIPLIYVGGWNGRCGGDSFLIPTAFRETERNYEIEADAAAPQATAKAGFDPSGLTRYLVRRLKTGSPRVAALEALSDRLPGPESQVTSSEFITVQREARAIFSRQ
jgi:beta-barrel assembly-enhancing protease